MATDSLIAKKNTSLLISLLCLIAGMVLLSYASVPLYRMFCQITGFGGTLRQSLSAPSGPVLARALQVTFNTDVSPELPWSFKAISAPMQVRLGERTLAVFEVTNHSEETITGVSTYNVTPDKLAPYIQKTQCFCFEKQKLKSGETMRFPVSFFIDPEMAKHTDLDDISTMTLSYTFFRATSDD